MLRGLLIVLLTLVAPAAALAADGLWVDVATPIDQQLDPAVATLADGSVLVAGGFNTHWQTAASERYLPAGNRWAWVPPMPTARSNASAVTLRDGRVLVTGGRISSFAPYDGTTAAEIYDPATDRWQATAPMLQARAFHRSVLLADGRVLVVGVDGLNMAGATIAAEVWDPATGRWTATEPMHVTRYDMAVVPLADGRVLAAGGGYSFQADRAEIYDPASNRWSEAAPMHEPRSLADGALLADGRVLIAGGYDFDNYSFIWSEPRVAEVYDPREDTWTLSGELAVPRVGATMVSFGDGRPALVGGNYDDDVSGGALGYRNDTTLEAYDSEHGSWTRSVPARRITRIGVAVGLADGSVLVTNEDFDGAAAAERFLPPGTPAPPPPGPAILPTPTPVATATPQATASPTATATPIATPAAIATPAPTVVLGPAAGPVTNRVGRVSFGAARRLTVSRTRVLAVKLSCSRAGTCTDTLVLRVGGKTLARAKVSLRAGRSGTVKLKLSSASALRISRRGTKATLTLSRGGTARTVTLKLDARRR